MTVSLYDIPPRLKADGSPCCNFFDAAGPRLLMACDECRTYFFHEEGLRRDAAPVDGYKVGLAQLKAASATPESKFEDEWKARRLRDLQAEYTRSK